MRVYELFEPLMQSTIIACKRFFVNAVRIGVNRQMDDNKRRKIIIVNATSFFPALLAFCLAIPLLNITGLPQMFYGPLAEGSALLLPPVLNKMRRYKLATYVMFGTHYLGSLYFILVLGNMASPHVLFLFLFILSLLLFHRRIHIAIAWFLLMAQMIFVLVNRELRFIVPMASYHDPGMETANLIIFFSVVIVTLLVGLFYREHFRKYSQSLVKQKHRLRFFLSKTSHDIRHYSDIIGKFSGKYYKDEPVTTVVIEDMKDLVIAHQCMELIIKNEYSYAEIERGESEAIEKESFSIRYFVNDLTRILSVIAKAQAVDVCCEIDRDVPDMVLYDKKKLHRILLNLLTNAIKFSPKYSIVLLQLKRERENLVFSVIDRGRGISAEQIKKIFLAGYTKGGESQNIEGRGIGLTIAEHYAKCMGGKILVSSVEEQGSTFALHLPLEVSVLSPSKGNEREKYQQVNITVLVFDDDEITRRWTEVSLKRMGASVILSGDEREVVHLADQYMPDIIILDYNMRYMNGLQALEKLRLSSHRIPVIFITGNAEKEFLNRLIMAGGSAYLIKPFTFHELYQVVLRVQSDGLLA